MSQIEDSRSVNLRFRNRQLFEGRERGRCSHASCPHSSTRTMSTWVREAYGVAENSDLLQKYGVRVRFIGRIEMLPLHVRQAVRDMEDMTKDNTEWVSSGSKTDLRGVLNVCCPYSSRDEITQAMEKVISQERNGDISVQQVYTYTLLILVRSRLDEYTGTSIFATVCGMYSARTKVEI